METTYHLVLEGTTRGNTKLVTNTGYTFNIRKRRPNGTIDWQCTVRRKHHRCKASVIQRDGAFFAGMHGHNHPGEFGVLASTQIQSCVKQVQLIYFFKLFLKFVQITDITSQTSKFLTLTLTLTLSNLLVGGEKTSLGGEYVGGEIVPWWRVRWWRVCLVAR